MTDADRFDRLLTGLDGLPGSKQARPTTVVDSLPIVGTAVTYVVQSIRTDDGQMVTFLQIVDADGRARLVLPDKVVNAIVKQRSRLFDRSTTASRKRKARSAQLRKKREQDHREGKHDPEARMARDLPPRMKGCPLCQARTG